ncbi:MAG TPA: DNRLRE domain-containing protein [Kofleriaceae bacterium]|nr:DNRLRE domain-containing protein [Kofleriaceae bacterium]
MRGALLTAIACAAACYEPAIPAGGRCSQSGDCPADQECVAGICGGTDIDPDPGSTVIVVGTDRSQLRDTELLREFPDDNYGDQDHFSVDDFESGVLSFDLSAVPPGLVLVKAALRVVTFDEASPDGGTVLVYRVLESWDERTATWRQRSANSQWTGDGASPPSRDPEPVAELRPRQPFTPYEIELPPDVVKGWLADPASNFGLTFVRGTSTRHVHIATRETGQWSTLTLELR